MTPRNSNGDARGNIQEKVDLLINFIFKKILKNLTQPLINGCNHVQSHRKLTAIYVCTVECLSNLKIQYLIIAACSWRRDKGEQLEIVNGREGVDKKRERHSIALSPFFLPTLVALRHPPLSRRLDQTNWCCHYQ